MSLLQRYILKDLLRVFGLSLSGLVILLMFVGVVGEAWKNGLGPEQIFQILPYVVPSLLPFTIPATLLLSVCIVYGRMAGDHEITALKAAGISVTSVLTPALFLGGLLSLCTLVLTDQFIPWARARIQHTVTAAMEDIFLDLLRSQNHLVDARTGLSVSAQAVEGRVLVKPTFRYRAQGGSAVTVRAETAEIRFDLEQQAVLLKLEQPYFQRGNFRGWRKEWTLRFPLPQERKKLIPRELTIQDIERELERTIREADQLEQQRLIRMAMVLTHGDFEQFGREEFNHFAEMEDKHAERFGKLRTEIHSRFALSCSCFFFVWLGAPFSIWQGRRQFLLSFALCFFPILLVYYPLMIGGMTICRTNAWLPPAGVMWLGNIVLGTAGCWVWSRIRQH